MGGEGSSRTPGPARPAQGPKVRTLACPSCGQPLTVRGLLQTDSIACAACGSVIDLTDESLKVISTFRTRARIQPVIPLGARGKLFGETLELIGFLRRKVTVEYVDYEWSEYLLFNPYKGFRWLSEYNGHWTFIRTIPDRPSVAAGVIRYLNRQFRHFQKSSASVSYVIGEFFWRVQVGETAVVDDWVSPPYMLSREWTDDEIVWSLGQYVEPQAIWSAFRATAPTPARIGVYSCQPSPYRATASKVYGLLGRFLFAALILQVLVLFMAQNRLVYQGDFTYDPQRQEKSFVTNVFELSGRTSNVVVHTRADVSNSWIYLNYALIEEATGHAYDFGREVSYYSGRDSDGAWSEGRQEDDAVLPSVPAGRYYLRIEPEGEPRMTPYSVRIYRDVPRWTFFWLALVALVAAPAFLFWRQRQFEIQRWSESDHPMWTASDLSSGDDD
jgi:Domain of unknown function (DUF4178)